MTIRTLHRQLGVALALLWLVQASTGVLLVFRWEIDDATVSARRVSLDDAAIASPRVPLDLNALGARIESLDWAGGKVASIWSAATQSGRFDIYYADESGAPRVMRVDGSGGVLRDRSARMLIGDGALFDTIMGLHEFLLAGALGRWLIAISGGVLLTNVALGIRQVWPQLRNWRRALFMRPQGPARLRARAWHRFIGMWGMLPAVLVLTTGLILALLEASGPASSSDMPVPETSASSAPIIGPARALATALALHPGSNVSVLQMPSNGRAWYRVRLHAPDEVRRNWGTTAVFIAAAGGAVIADRPAAPLATTRGLLDAAYPIHTGQIWGWAGRVLALLVGVWLVALVWLGTQSWWGFAALKRSVSDEEIRNEG